MSYHDIRDDLAYRRLTGKLRFWESALLWLMNWRYRIRWPSRDPLARELKKAKKLLKSFHEEP